MSAARILVVDDTPQNLLLLVRFLEAKGYQVDAAASTAEADQALSRAVPRLALVDVSLPDEDGLSWVRRTVGRAPHTRFVAVTAFASADVRAEAYAAGCHGFITKPFALKTLLSTVESQLGAAQAPHAHA